MAQTQLSQDAHGQVQGHSHDDVDTERNQQPFHKAGYMSCSHQNLHNDIGGHHHAVCNHIIYEYLSFRVALHTGTYTFSLIFLPRMASDICEDMYALDRISMTPSRIPPIKAPGMEPIPPNTAATKALIPGMEPV